ncbi:hypothetical protein V6N13_071470 [Hibiscus sabdariffa]
MARNRPSSSSFAPPRFFVDDEAQERKKVKEDKFDEVVSGISGITLEKLPTLMGFKGGKAKESTEEHPQSGAIPNALAKLETLEESVK